MDSKVIVITGASSGIGASLAKNLGARGNRLVLGARREELLVRVSKEAGAKARPVVADVTRRKDVEHLRDVALSEFGHIDVWVNNAGRGTGKTVMELTDEEIQEIVDVVLKSVLYGMQAIVPHFQERGQGHLINVSSFLGRVPLVSARSIYSAAKSGVNVLTSNLRMDLRTKYPGIHVSLVMPGTVETEFHRIVQSPYPVKAGARTGAVTVQSADDVAGQIVSLIDHPVDELYIPESLNDMVRSYYQDISAFEARMAQRQ